MHLLAAVTFVAFAQTKLASTARCPQAPYAAAAPGSSGAGAVRCPALEVTGRIDRAAPVLDPAFDVAVSVVEFAQSAPAAPNALLTGYAADGRQLFAVPLAAAGQFRMLVPLAPAVLNELSRLRLASGGSFVERTAYPHGEPAVEVISVDDAHVLIAWNGQHFPGLNVREYGSGALIGAGSGESTYEQLTVSSTAPQLVLEFSDGVHSFSRTVHVFGR